MYTKCLVLTLLSKYFDYTQWILYDYIQVSLIQYDT